MVAKKVSDKPSKPRPDFPLYAHARGYWCKSYGGAKYNCGAGGDPAAAERKWLEIKSRLDRGEPVNTTGRATVKTMCNLYPKEQNRRASMGDLSNAHAREVRGYCVHLLRHFGPTLEIATIRKEDFAAIKSNFPAEWTLRSQRKLFTAAQIWSLLLESRPQMRAMIWLGINAAYGNDDCSELREHWIDWDQQWLARPRGKTGKDRAALLWPETIAAIREVLDGHRPSPHDQAFATHIFLTRTGKLWVDREATNRDSIGEQFRELTKTVGCYQKLVGFYSLRHTFATIASRIPAGRPSVG